MIGLKDLVKRNLTPERYRQLRQALGIEKTQWARVVMDQEAFRLVRALPYTELDALEISGDGLKQIRLSFLPTIELSRVRYLFRPRQRGNLRSGDF